VDPGSRGKVTYALTICDYDPATMSPNPDGVYEELPFKEGQVVKVRISCWLVLSLLSVLKKYRLILGLI